MGLSASELRIGNWVKGDTGKPFRFELSDFLDWWNDHNSHEFGDHIHPIPITEEWLLKFGFESEEEDENFFFKKHDVWLTISISKNDFSIGLTADIDGGSIAPSFIPRNVHQLQNLYYALTGEEL